MLPSSVPPVDCPLDACFNFPSPSSSRSPQVQARLRVMLKYQSCDYHSNVSLLFHLSYQPHYAPTILPTRFLLPALFIDSDARAHTPEISRSHRTVQDLIARIYLVPSPVAFLDLFVSPFAAPELTLSYTKPKHRFGLFVSPSRLPSLMPATWLLSPL